jgi:hypothetical protein
MITIATLQAAGLSDAQIVRVLKVEHEERLAQRREQNRINQRNQRARQQNAADVADTADMVPIKEIPPIPPKENPSPSLSSITQSKREPDFFDKPAEPVESGDPVDEDTRAKLYRIGKLLLVTFGIAEKRTGSLLGHWLKQTHDDADGLLALIQYARDADVAEPIAYISALVNGRSGNGKAAGGAELAYRMAEEIRERKRALGFPVDERKGVA